MPKSLIEEYLQYKCLYPLTYTNSEQDGFTRFVTTDVQVLLETQLSGPREWINLGVEMDNGSLMTRNIDAVCYLT
jgi:hypothetical protein